LTPQFASTRAKAQLLNRGLALRDAEFFQMAAPVRPSLHADIMAIWPSDQQNHIDGVTQLAAQRWSMGACVFDDQASVPSSERDRAEIAAIVEKEREMGCR
jgi:hypothetical protein